MLTVLSKVFFVRSLKELAFLDFSESFLYFGN